MISVFKLIFFLENPHFLWENEFSSNLGYLLDPEIFELSSLWVIQNEQ